jgi:hypothetical protein
MDRRLRLPNLDSELHVFATKVRMHIAETGDVTARMRETFDQTDTDGVAYVDK